MDQTRVQQLLKDEMVGADPRVIAAQVFAGLFPPYVGNRLRTQILRWLGLKIGRGSIFWGMPKIIGGWGALQRLQIGSITRFNVEVFLDLSGPIYIGNNISVGPQAMLMTGRHDLGDSSRRTGPLSPAPITICDGSWIGARALIMPGITIGTGAVVGAGAVVTRDVQPNTIVAGTPARIIRDLDA